MMIRQYSHLFSCLYDQPAPVGRLGRGVHHSVFRTTQFRAIDGAPLGAPRIHDFAVIWDEDHDERIVHVAERLHLQGLLWPVVFLGERKGVVTLLLDWAGGPDVFVDESIWLDRIRSVAADADDTDTWEVDIGMFQRLTASEDGARMDTRRIIPEARERVVPYLQAIDVLWLLGSRDGAGSAGAG